MKRAALPSTFLLAALATSASSLSVQAATSQNAVQAAANETAANLTPVRCSLSSTEGLNEVWARYVQGLQTGNLLLLKSIFAAQGSFHTLSRSDATGQETLSVQPFAEVLPTWASSPDPQTIGSLGQTTVNRNMAVVQGSLHFGATRYDDVLTLYCTKGRWQIVGKMTVGRPR